MNLVVFKIFIFKSIKGRDENRSIRGEEKEKKEYSG